jgi:signal transduction histidine kinase/CheY-like chemotaxis protein
VVVEAFPISFKRLKAFFKTPKAAAPTHAHFKSICDALPFMVAVLDREGLVTYANPLCQREAQSSPAHSAEIETILNRIHTEDLSRLRKLINEATLNGIGFEEELRIRPTHEGPYLWHQCKVQALEPDQWLVSCIDIDARRRTQEALRFLADSSLVLATSLDADITLTRVSRIAVAGFSELCFVHLKDEKGRLRVLARACAAPNFEPAGEVFEKTVFGAHSSTWYHTFRMGRSKLETQARDIFDGKIVSFIIVPLFLRGEIVGSLSFVSGIGGKHYDVQDLEVAEELARRASTSIENLHLFAKSEEANRAKSAFLANMSHEIRTPLAAVLGYSELMLQAEQSESEQIDCIHAIQRNGQQLTRLVDDLLDLTKVEADRLHVEDLSFSLAKLICDLRSLVHLQARQKGVRVAFINDGLVPEQISSDPTRLRQILLNIVGNALKFTSHGEVTVTLRCTPVQICDQSAVLETKDHFLEFEVRDTGLGMSLEQQQRLFEPFCQADNSTTRRFGGTGLGLILSRKLSRLLGGDLWLVDSALERGSCFMVKVPVRVAAASGMLETLDSLDASDRLEPASRPQTTPRPLKGLRVLLVEDSPDNQYLIGRILSQGGASVEMACNGKEALEKAVQHEFDIILMDIQMPEIDGYEATRELRSRGFRAPILALTAHALTEERMRSLQAGCNDHLTKPVDRRSLIQKVSLWAARSAGLEWAQELPSRTEPERSCQDESRF